MATRTVSNAAELAEAVNSHADVIEVHGTITGSPMITLEPGVTLRGGTLVFTGKGVRLTSGNTLDNLRVETVDSEIAILNDATVEDFGTLTLRNVSARGQIQIVAEGHVRAGHVAMDMVHVESADLRGRSHRPAIPGMEVLQGAVTVWNATGDPAVVLTAVMLNVSAGTQDNPIRGTGIMVGGTGRFGSRGDGGAVRVTNLTTGEVNVDGGIAEGTPDIIAGGVFVIAGGEVDQVVNAGTVSTHGPNDMVLDNWGVVKTWTAQQPITSYGPSGIGFVNFGDLDLLDVRAPIRTFGGGARGFNLYEGTLREARFMSIDTAGDGAVGIQISRPLSVLQVEGDVTTSGGEGLSLVKGVQMPLKAVALSVKPGGTVDRIDIGGKLATSGPNVVTLEVGGVVSALSVAGGIYATGAGADGAHVAAGAPDLAAMVIEVAEGQQVVRI